MSTRTVDAARFIIHTRRSVDAASFIRRIESPGGKKGLAYPHSTATRRRVRSSSPVHELPLARRLNLTHDVYRYPLVNDLIPDTRALSIALLIGDR